MGRLNNCLTNSFLVPFFFFFLKQACLLRLIIFRLLSLWDCDGTHTVARCVYDPNIAFQSAHLCYRRVKYVTAVSTNLALVHAVLILDSLYLPWAIKTSDLVR